MNWKFWRKDIALKRLDPHMLAVIMVQSMVGHTYPFNKWRDDENPIPESADAFVEVAVNVYQLCIFLDFIERQFGTDVAEIVRSNLITVMSKGKTGDVIKKFFDAVRTGRTTRERELFFTDSPAIQVDCNVAKALLSIASEPEDVKHALYPNLGQSLTLGRISAESSFGELVKQIEFRPESVFGFRKPEEIPVRWSEACGCFERQLQRRHNNALFPPAKRRITTGELIEAQSRDLADLEKLQADSQKFIDELWSLPDGQKLTFNEINKWRERVQEFIMRAAAVGNIADSHRERLRPVYNGVVNTHRKSCPPEHKAQLEAAIANSDSYQKTWSNLFVAQVTRKDTPITPDDLLPSLLVEDVETVRLMVSTMTEENRIAAGRAAAVLIQEAKKEGYTVPDAEEKVRAFNES
jgi:hypothetical protein